LTKTRFIEPMLLLRKEHLPEGRDWQYELKLDGYRAIAFKTNGKLHLRSRNDNDFLARYPAIGQALEALSDNTVIDGEIVALHETGKPSFNTLQNHGSSGVPLVYFVFDLLILSGRDVMREPLEKRQALLKEQVLTKLSEPVRHIEALDARLPDLIDSIKTSGLEGFVAKRRDSAYEPGQRSGAWQKMRVNQGQEFVIQQSA
jgi:ATP-dependent DNA ligase